MKGVSSVIVIVLDATSLMVCVQVTQNDCSVLALDAVEHGGHVDAVYVGGVVRTIDSGEASLDFTDVFVQVFAFPFRVHVINVGSDFAVEICADCYGEVGVFDNPCRIVK